MVKDSDSKYMHMFRKNNKCYLMLAGLEANAELLMSFGQSFFCISLIKHGESYYVVGFDGFLVAIYKFTSVFKDWSLSYQIGRSFGTFPTI